MLLVSLVISMIIRLLSLNPLISSGDVLNSDSDLGIELRLRLVKDLVGGLNSGLISRDLVAAVDCSDGAQASASN